MPSRALRLAVRAITKARPPMSRRVISVMPKTAGMTVRNFSGSARRLGNGESDSALSAAISAEHSYEIETASEDPEVPQFLEAFRAQGVWEVQDNPGADDVVLTRKFGNESLKLTFQISDIDPLPESSDSADLTDIDGTLPTSPPPPGTTADAAEIDTPPYITVSLIISKPAHPNAMSVDMEAGEEGMVVTNVAMFERAVALQEGSEGDWVRGGRYMGPQFEHLDGGVQEAFQAYLAERGVDDSLAQFILSYAEFKEQRDYVSWLEQIKGFVDE